MGTVDLLTRDGEIEIAKRVEQGMKEVQYIMAYWPGTIKFVLSEYEQTLTDEKKISDVVTGFLPLHDDHIELKDDAEIDLEKPKKQPSLADDDVDDDGDDIVESDDSDDSGLDPT